MKNKLLLTALLSTAFTNAVAQSAFEGFYGQAGIGYERVTPSLSVGNLVVTGTGTLVGTYPFTSSISSSNSFTGVLGMGHYFTISPDLLIGIGAEYSPIQGQSANYSATNATLGRVNATYKKENAYNIFLSPATPIGKDGLLYGKIGYTGATVKATGSSTSTSNKLTGYSIGAGYKQFFSKELYGFGEFNYSNYGDNVETESTTSSTYRLTQSTTFSANTANIIIGIGYKF